MLGRSRALHRRLLSVFAPGEKVRLPEASWSLDSLGLHAAPTEAIVTEKDVESLARVSCLRVPRGSEMQKAVASLNTMLESMQTLKRPIAGSTADPHGNDMPKEYEQIYKLHLREDIPQKQRHSVLEYATQHENGLYVVPKEAGDR